MGQAAQPRYDSQGDQDLGGRLGLGGSGEDAVGDVPKHVFGPDEVVVPRHGFVERPVEVVTVRVTGGTGGDVAALKRRAVWLNPVRDRHIARLASAPARGDRDSIAAECPALATRLLGVDRPCVVVLVENVEHALAPAGRLPGWPIVAGPGVVTDGLRPGQIATLTDCRGPGEGLPARVIATLAGLESVGTAEADVLIRADGGPGVPEALSALWITPNHQARPPLLVDPGDRHHPVLRRRARRRRDAYATRGWAVDGRGVAADAIGRFLAGGADMSSARRRSPRPGPPGSGPGDFYRRRRARALPAPTTGAPSLDPAAHPEAPIAAYDALAARGGAAPGPDGLTYADLGRGEACAILRGLSPAILGGAYAPGAGRRPAIPKPAGGTRTLTIVDVLDRAVAAAVARALTPAFEATSLGSSYGFRPGLGAWDLLADLRAAMAALRLTTPAIDDVKEAFDHVPIAPLMEAFSEHIDDARLLHLVEAILRGGEDRDRAVGIPQGNPLSPLALNVSMHRVHDLPLEADAIFPPRYRYVDNSTYLCGGVPEGHRALDRVRELLAHADLALKGQDGPPIDLREGGNARLPGFRLSLRDGRLRLDLGEDALGSDLARSLVGAHDDPDPQRMARTALRGWAASHGPALGDPTETDLETILRTAARHGFRDLASREELAGWCTAAYGRWTGRHKAALTRLGLTGEDLLSAAAPPATVEPGV